MDAMCAVAEVGLDAEFHPRRNVSSGGSSELNDASSLGAGGRRRSSAAVEVLAEEFAAAISRRTSDFIDPHELAELQARTSRPDWELIRRKRGSGRLSKLRRSSSSQGIPANETLGGHAAGSRTGHHEATDISSWLVKQNSARAEAREQTDASPTKGGFIRRDMNMKGMRRGFSLHSKMRSPSSGGVAANGSGARISAATLIMQEKLKAGVITQEEYDAMIKVNDAANTLGDDFGGFDDADEAEFGGADDDFGGFE